MKTLCKYVDFKDQLKQVSFKGSWSIETDYKEDICMI